MNKILPVILMVMVLGTIASNMRTFYVQKDYTFTTEAACDQSNSRCFVRDCSDDSCPPNGLEIYREFTLNASDFSKCADNSCLNECTSGSIQCTESNCGDSPDDICSEIISN